MRPILGHGTILNTLNNEAMRVHALLGAHYIIVVVWSNDLGSSVKNLCDHYAAYTILILDIPIQHPFHGFLEWNLQAQLFNEPKILDTENDDSALQTYLIW